MSDAGEDGVDGICGDAEQEVSFEMAIGLHVADHGFDGGASRNSRRMVGVMPRFWRETKIFAFGFDPVAAIPTIDIGAGDGNASDPQARGSAAPTKMPMGCCVSTSRKAPT